MNEPEPPTSVAADMPDADVAEPEQQTTEDAAQEQSATDDVKLRFREALERKQRKNAAIDAAGTSKDPSKVHSARGPAASRRSFRRKSG